MLGWSQRAFNINWIVKHKIGISHKWYTTVRHPSLCITFPYAESKCTVPCCALLAAWYVGIKHRNKKQFQPFSCYIKKFWLKKYLLPWQWHHMLQPLILWILGVCLLVLYWQSREIWMCAWRGKGLSCAASRKQEQQMRIPHRGFHYMVLMRETTLWNKYPGHCLVFNPFTTKMKSCQTRLTFPRV